MSDVDELNEAEAGEIEHGPLIDLSALGVKADERYDKMKANPDHKGDPDLTYSAAVRGVIAQAHQSISDLLRGEAQVRAANADRNGIGPIARGHLLAVQVLDGVFDVDGPAPPPDPIPDA